MIVKISSIGSSFKGLSDYLTHDVKADTAERVAWTYTHNLANDHVPSAVDEMVWTARNAELLKQEAGIRAGGRATENTVKSISLNWSPEEKPSRDHMISTAEGYLKKMGWHEHQAVFVAHNDKPHQHVHIMLNAVHPETGLHLNEGFEQRRTQKWALAYEREQGRIYCGQRELNAEDREKAMSRNLWMGFQNNEQKFLNSERQLYQNSEIPEYSPKMRKSEEWEIFKNIQRDEREAFFADGANLFKQLRTSIYRENREEFRERWADYYQAKKNGTENDREILAETKNQLIADQKSGLKPRQEAACAGLLKARKLEYQELLDNQRTTRATFSSRLASGLDNAEFFHDLTEARNARKDAALAFREASTAMTRNTRAEPSRSPGRGEVEHGGDRAAHSGRQKGIGDVGKKRVISGIGAVLDSLFIALAGPGPRPPEPDPDAFRAAAEEAAKQKTPAEYRAFDDERKERHRALYGE